MKLLPQKLAEHGFRSYMVGKGHIGSRSVANLPISRGFDHHLGFLGGGEDHWTQSNGDVVDLWLDNQPAWGLNGTAYSCDMYSTKAVALIEDHAANHPTDGMFLYLPFHCVHEPYEAEARFIDPSIPDSGRQTMAAMVSCVSEGTGNVSRALKRTGMWADTIFLWSADNGGPQYWLGNNHPLRGGKGVDFEGGVAVAAFVTGGALPQHLRGQVSTSPMHVADLHFTICLLAGVDEAGCRDDDIAGVPPIDGVDFRAAFAEVNQSRPLAAGSGASAGTYEVFLSTNGGDMGDQELGDRTGAYIDFNLSNGGPWKFVRNTSRILNNPASPLGNGYWTGPRWPGNGGNHTPLEPDPGCPPGGCLFNLRIDRTEHREFSAEQPALKASMAARLRELIASRFQTSTNYTAGYDNCSAASVVVARNRGFIGPCCTKGATWAGNISCEGLDFERYAVAEYRGSWACSGGVLTAADDAGRSGAAIGFARVRGAGVANARTIVASLKLDGANDSATCDYTFAGVIVGMGSGDGTAGSDFRDQFDGYSITITPPDCTGRQAELAVRRHNVGAAGASPTSQKLAGHPLGAVDTGDWLELRVTTTDSAIAVAVNGAAAISAPLLPGKPVGCGKAAPIGDREPWEPVETPDACGFGVYMHRATASWRGIGFPGDAVPGPVEVPGAGVAAVRADANI